eukprot:TRINITY_DN9767_c0_g1_i3.p1 TRINITY_DN9767_c0_g1~~TRINITY_DN9767_c0_g1_i3.p1  ORF type:complete len:193 (+),score=5.35 TRINITY_DN9767_c0_g1_i3:290-868(+)
MALRKWPPCHHLLGYDDDALLFNDLYFNHTLRADLRTFIKSRQHCHGRHEHGGVDGYCLAPDVNYGFRVLGNVDPHKELLPTQLRMDSNLEPDYSTEDGRHEKPGLLAAEVVVSGLEEGQHYALLRYEDRHALPGGGRFLQQYLQSGGVPVYFGGSSSGIWRRRVTFMSNSTVFFRVVRASGKDPSEVRLLI